MRKLYIQSERYFKYESNADLIACDFHSVESGLNKIQDGYLRMGYVDDDYHELQLIAADLSVMLERAIEEFSMLLPLRNTRYGDRESGICWFNSAISLYNGTDMSALLENEEKYDDRDEINEKSLRLRAVNSLTKEQHMLLLIKTYEIVFRYLRLKSELDVLVGVDGELERLHSFKKKGDNTELPKSAWV